MKKPRKTLGTTENRELAFRVYATMEGRDVPAILERLKKDFGLSISHQTLYRWRREGGWALRMPRAKEREPSTLEVRLFQRAMKLIERYEADLERRPRVESQDVFAYASLARAALELSRRLPAGTGDSGEMRRLAREILESDFGVRHEQ